MEAKEIFEKRLDLLNDTLDNLIIDISSLKEVSIDCDKVIISLRDAISIVEFKINDLKQTTW